MNRRSQIALIITATVIAVAVASVAILLYLASMEGLDLSKRVITDPVEGTETKAVENPAPPEHPAFPSPSTVNLSSSTGVNGNNSSVEQTLFKHLKVWQLLLSLSSKGYEDNLIP